MSYSFDYLTRSVGVGQAVCPRVSVQDVVVNVGLQRITAMRTGHSTLHVVSVSKQLDT